MKEDALREVGRHAVDCGTGLNQSQQHLQVASHRLSLEIGGQQWRVRGTDRDNYTYSS